MSQSVGQRPSLVTAPRCDVHLTAVADSTKGIDGFFDKLDGFFDTVDSVGHTLRTGQVRKPSSAKPKVARAPVASIGPSGSTAISKRGARYRLEEVTDATTGVITFLVTDGMNARCEFTDRPTAEKVLRMLEAQP